MANCELWVATGRNGFWLPYPSQGASIRRASAISSTVLTDGGAWVNRAPAYHKVYNFDFKGDAATTQKILQLFSGSLNYGIGTVDSGLLYFPDPSSLANLLPPHWAEPGLSGMGWPTLVRKQKAVVIPNTTAAVYTPPPSAAQYTVPGVLTFDKTVPRATLVIPPGKILKLVAWGSATNGGVIRINRYSRTGSSGILTSQDLTPSATGSVFTLSGDTFSHVEIWLTRTGTTGTATLTLGGMVATLETATPTAWVPGDGHNGCKISEELAESIINLNATKGRVNPMTFTGVGSWAL